MGFVPTMGALHSGHLSLIEKAKAECDFVLASIFVNPTQFNDKRDFDHYPRNLSRDLSLLNDSGCDLVFTPAQEEMYPQADTIEYHFGGIEQQLEGAFRPGHFQGVAMVVRRFFEIIRPHKAFFGWKDFQQVLVIRSLVKQYNLGVEIVAVPTSRENDGLAMSSRNQLLSPKQRLAAPLIYKVLQGCKKRIQQESMPNISRWLKSQFEQNTELDLEYFEVVDPDTFQPIMRHTDAPHAVALIAVRAGSVRLIDNLELY